MIPIQIPHIGAGAILLATLLALPACNTIEGAGQDLQALGSATSKAATKYNPDKANQTPPPQPNQNPYK